MSTDGRARVANGAAPALDGTGLDGTQLDGSVLLASVADQLERDHPAPQSALMSRLARTVVAIHKRRLGRGATHARASWFGGDAGVIVTLADLYTPAERTMIEWGRFSAVQTSRDAMYRVIEADLNRAAKEITEREVIASLSQVSEQPQLGCVVFLLDASR